MFIFNEYVREKVIFGGQIYRREHKHKKKPRLSVFFKHEKICHSIDFFILIETSTGATYKIFRTREQDGKHRAVLD